MGGRYMALEDLPRALRDRAGKVQGQDHNTMEYLVQAASAVEDLRAQVAQLQRRVRELERDQAAPPPPAPSPGRSRGRRPEPELETDLWDLDGPSDDDLLESEDW